MKTVLALIFLVLPQLISGYLQHIPDLSWLNEHYRNLWRTNDYNPNYFFDFYEPSHQTSQRYKLRPINNYNLDYGGKKHTQIDFSSKPFQYYPSKTSNLNLNQFQPQPFYQSQRQELNHISNLNQIQPQFFYQPQNEAKSPNPTVQTRAVSMTSTDINGFSRGIVTPGSGSLGITKLSNGQFALGSGSLGYGASPVQSPK
ncbi:uncharacterized protein [Onthophagus taurus]|uniref:uncharacterized protein n=1 Tax=Onthophagus taurus TaxID=166361 RepID=UPI000C204C39|nr:uncharacterized protein LOC111414444 [Onthophagus taurus]